ncbi:MAG TPA: aspartyl protease family protein [Candidatus Angelobacter sp.]|nr:aspartyl protease family protein [Candidatus Angelobacter sp.]
MSLRMPKFFAFIVLFTIPGFSQTVPTAQEVAAKWRAAIGAAHATSPRTAVLACSSTEDGIPGSIEETLSSSSEYHRSVKREFDEAELVFAGQINQRRDWNGFVREMRGKELERLRTMALQRRLLVFGPLPEKNMVKPAVSLSEDGKSYVLRFATAGTLPVTWTIDAQTGLPTKSEHPGEDSVITSYYSDWQKNPTTETQRHGETWGDHSSDIRFPRHVRVTETDKPDYTMECTELRFTPPAKDFFPLQPGPSDTKLDAVVPPIPFTMEANHIVFKVSVNGREPMAFILDTGADQEVIDEKRMAAFGLKTYAGTTTTGGGNSAPYNYSKDATFTLPGVTLSNQHVAVIDQTGLERALGVPFGGILGYDFISRFVIEIDYAKKLITLHDPKKFQYTGKGFIVPVTFDNGIPFADGVISVAGKTIPAYFVLDSGAAETMTLTSPFVKAHDLANLAQTNATVNRPAGLEKQFFAQNNVRGHIDRLQLGQMEVRSIPINMSVNTSGAYASENFSGTVGESIFSRYHVFLDYPHNRVILEPTPEVDKPFPERKTYGLSLLASGDDLHTYTVSAVRPDSAAAADGFQKGDVVSALDGQPASQFTLSQLRDVLSQEGTKHSLTVMRNGNAVAIVFEVKLVSLDKK